MVDDARADRDDGRYYLLDGKSLEHLVDRVNMIEPNFSHSLSNLL